jgi:hypothetical protein
MAYHSLPKSQGTCYRRGDNWAGDRYSGKPV